MTGSQAALLSRSTADWARSGSAMTANHSSGARFDVSTVAARWWRSMTSVNRLGFQGAATGRLDPLRSPLLDHAQEPIDLAHGVQGRGVSRMVVA